MARRLVQALAVLALAAAAPAAAQNGGVRTVRDGVFSAEQVRRGQAVFSNICSACHSKSQFVGDGGFQKNWEGRTFFDVFDQISSTMPNDDPGGLPRRDYIDVIIYLLSENGYPVGNADLPGSDQSLKSIRIVPLTRPAPERHAPR